MQPTDALPTDSKISIQLPSSITINDGICFIGSSTLSQTESTCTITSNLLTLTKPFGLTGSFAQGGPVFTFILTSNAYNPSIS